MDNPTKLEAINTVLTTIANTTTNEYGKVALNVYQIFPKKIYYPLSALTNYSTDNTVMVMGAQTTLYQALSSFNIGYSYPKSFTISYVGTAQSGRQVDIDYVNVSGDLVRVHGFTTSGANTTFNPDPQAININRIVWSDTVANNNIPNTVEIVVKDTTFYRNRINSTNCGTAIITIPNGYIGVISDIGIYVNSQGLAVMNPGELERMAMYVIDSKNNTIFTHYMDQALAIPYRYNSMGSISHVLYPGESVFFASHEATNEKIVHALVTLTAI